MDLSDAAFDPARTLRRAVTTGSVLGPARPPRSSRATASDMRMLRQRAAEWALPAASVRSQVSCDRRASVKAADDAGSRLMKRFASTTDMSESARQSQVTGTAANLVPRSNTSTWHNKGMPS